MAATKKVVPPTDRQLGVLESLTGGRRLKVTTSQKGDKPTKSAEVTTATGRAVSDVKVHASAVESCVTRGWIARISSGSEPSNNDHGAASFEFYEITPAGKAAKKLK